MNLVIEREALHRALAQVAWAADRRGAIPITSHVKLATEGERLLLSCTDLDRAATVFAPAIVRGYGAVTVPVATLQAIAAKTEAGAQIEMQADNEQDHAPLALAAGRARFTLPRLPVGDWPELAGTGEVRRITLPAGHLRRAIDVCGHAMSTEETRYYLCGLFLHRTDSGLRTVATDGHRLAAFDIPDTADAPADFPSVIVPRQMVTGIHKLLRDQTGPIDLAVCENIVTVRMGALTVTSKLIDGTFPDYQRVIPRDNTDRLTVTAAALARAVERVSAVNSDKGHGIRLLATRDACTVSARDAALNQQAEDSLDAADFQHDGAAIEIGFNAKYLAALIDAAETDRLEFRFSGAATPMLAAIPGDGGVTLVLMPMRV